MSDGECPALCHWEVLESLGAGWGLVSNLPVNEGMYLKEKVGKKFRSIFVYL